MTRQCDSEYYQRLHDSHPAFQENNWLLQDLPRLVRLGGESILELGCGNGRFLEVAARHWRRVVGLDWAASPVMPGILEANPGIEFVQSDLRGFVPREPFDVVVSADFLEHLPTTELVPCLARMHQFGFRHFHRIACYDDGHSHLSILSPDQWLELFDQVAPAAYRILAVEHRKRDPSKPVILVEGARATGA
jgi:cyclopropane fatty-acyl-phospholipid synthase-like methyltransferase